MSNKEVVETMLVINPSLTINQDQNHYNNTLLVKYKDIIAVKFKTWKTTTRHMVITVLPEIQMAHED